MKIFKVKIVIYKERKDKIKKLNIIAPDFIGAIENTAMWMLENHGETNFEILNVKEKKDSHVDNMPDTNDCDCPSCRYETAEVKIDFVHDCGLPIKVAGDGWQVLRCPQCQKDIIRSKVIFTPDDGWCEIE